MLLAAATCFASLSLQPLEKLFYLLIRILLSSRQLLLQLEEPEPGCNPLIARNDHVRTSDSAVQRFSHLCS